MGGWCICALNVGFAIGGMFAEEPELFTILLNVGAAVFMYTVLTRKGKNK